ncbi:MAG: methyltransferase domain-containing protein [Parcubacteria group bacterium]|nr:methyltransferase domain-containing protein [Parcubacteria group bacterium]
MNQLLFVGRMHITTKFQQEQLARFKHRPLKEFGVSRKGIVSKLIVIITSADHKGTKQNPLPIERRIEGIIPFFEAISIPYEVYFAPDIPSNNQWVDFLEKQVAYQSQNKTMIRASDTVLFSSTQSVIELFKKKGYPIIEAELDLKNEKFVALRPFEVIDLIARAGKNWTNANAEWKQHASTAAIILYEKYNFGKSVQEIHSEVLLTQEGSLAEGRNYTTYAQGMDAAMKLKWEDIQPFIKEGMIVDAACGTGTLLQYLSDAYPRSEIIGIDLAREFLRICESKHYANHNVYVFQKNVAHQNFKKNSVATKIFSSILHEVYSYNDYDTQCVRAALKNTYKELQKGGRVIIRDGVGPSLKETVYMKLRADDGAKTAREVKVLSTEGRFLRFAKEFKEGKGVAYSTERIGGELYYVLSARDAYEFMSKKDYADNWHIEVREEFGFWTFEHWKSELGKAGFKIIQGSRAYCNEWIRKNRFEGKVELFVKEKDNRLKKIPYFDTTIIVVGEKKE